MPSFEGGRPPKLDKDEQDELIKPLRDGQPWKSQEIQHLLAEEFDIEYHPNYLGTFLRNLGFSYAKPRPKRPHRPKNPDEMLEERVDDALDEGEQPHNKRAGEDGERWVVNEDVCIDGGTVVGFFDASQPQPYDNSRRIWYVNDPYVERPLVKTDDSSVGFYALNGESLVKFTEDETKERICEVLETIREQNPGKGFYSSWTSTARISVNTRVSTPISSQSISSSSRLDHHISTQSRKTGTNSSGRCVQSSSKMRVNSRISCRMCSSK